MKTELEKQSIKALQLWHKFWDEMPKGQLGNISCDIGILNDAFIETRKALEMSKKGNKTKS